MGKFYERYLVKKGGEYVDKVLAIFDAETGTETIYGQELMPDEELINAPPPKEVKPRWTGTEWEETATPEEIAAWELEHPAPTAPSAPTLDQRTVALEAAMLAMMGGGLDV